MGQAEAEVRAELRRIVQELMSLRYRLVGVRESLPPSPLELGFERELDFPPNTDEATNLRSTVATVLADRIEPAIADLARLAGAPSRGGTLA